MNTKWITHRGKRILKVDYRKCSSHQEMIEILDFAEKEIAASADKVLLMVSYEDIAIVAHEFHNRLKELHKKHGKVKIKKRAALGIDHDKIDYFYNEVFQDDKNTRFFKMEYDALDWLVK